MEHGRSAALRLESLSMATRARPKRSAKQSDRSRRTPVARLRAICLALPETSEKMAWGEPTWRVKGKLFAQLDNHHHGADHLAVWLPAPCASTAAQTGRWSR